MQLCADPTSFILLLGTSLVAGCWTTAPPHVDVADREVLVRHDEAGDRAEVLVIHAGIVAGGRPLGTALDYMERVARGKASFLHLPTSVDRALLATADLGEPLAFVDPEKGLCVAQEARFTDVRAGIERWNVSIREWILAYAQVTTPAGVPAEATALDRAFEETSTRVVESARSGGRFVRLEGNSFVFESPVAPALVDALLDGLHDEDLESLSSQDWFADIEVHLEGQTRTIDFPGTPGPGPGPANNAAQEEREERPSSPWATHISLRITPELLTVTVGRAEDPWFRIPSAPGLRVVNEPFAERRSQWRDLDFFEGLWWEVLRSHLAERGDPTLLQRLAERGAPVARDCTASKLRRDFLDLPQAWADPHQDDPALAFVPPLGFFTPSSLETDEPLEGLVFPPFFDPRALFAWE